MSRNDADPIVKVLTGEKISPLLTPCGESPGAHAPIMRPTVQFIADHVRSPAVEVALLVAITPILEDRLALAQHLGSTLELLANAMQNPTLYDTDYGRNTFENAMKALRKSIEASKV